VHYRSNNGFVKTICGSVLEINTLEATRPFLPAGELVAIQQKPSSGVSGGRNPIYFS
jgi:hypothetical protein